MGKEDKNKNTMNTLFGNEAKPLVPSNNDAEPTTPLQLPSLLSIPDEKATLAPVLGLPARKKELIMTLSFDDEENNVWLSAPDN